MGYLQLSLKQVYLVINGISICKSLYLNIVHQVSGKLSVQLVGMDILYT